MTPPAHPLEQAFLKARSFNRFRPQPVSDAVLHTGFADRLPEQFEAFDANPPLALATAQRNGTLQAAHLIVAARLLGLDCGPMSGFDATKVDREFFPDGCWKANLLVNLGYGDPSGNYPRGPRLPFEAVARIL